MSWENAGRPETSRQPRPGDGAEPLALTFDGLAFVLAELLDAMRNQYTQCLALAEMNGTTKGCSRQCVLAAAADRQSGRSARSSQGDLVSLDAGADILNHNCLSS